VTIRRRRWLELAAAATTAAASARLAGAQIWPARPIRLVVPLPAGGAADIIARLIAGRLERLGQPVIVDNKPGAGTTVGIQSVVTAPPDGYTLLVTTTASAIGATLYEKLPYNFLQDIAAVAGLVRFPLVMVVNRSVPASTVAEFIAYAKANPGKINMASAGTGTAPHLAGEMFKAMTGIDMTHVPYRGEPPALADMIAGQVQVIFSAVTASIEHLRSGALRALGVTTSERIAVLPDVPTIADTVPGYEASGWFGVGAPRGVPAEIVEKLAREINLGLANPTVSARIAALGSTPLAMSSAEFGVFMAAETAKWAKVVKLSGARPD
jgi:tripartite-type tricarboxylate transporter receptor subunit TctC